MSCKHTYRLYLMYQHITRYSHGEKQCQCSKLRIFNNIYSEIQSLNKHYRPKNLLQNKQQPLQNDLNP